MVFRVQIASEGDFFSAGRRSKPFLSADESFSRPFWNHQNSIIQFYHPWFKIHPGGLRFRTAFDNGTSGFFAFKGVWGRYVYVSLTQGHGRIHYQRGAATAEYVVGVGDEYVFEEVFCVLMSSAGGGRLVWLCLCHWRILERRVILFFRQVVGDGVSVSSVLFCQKNSVVSFWGGRFIYLVSPLRLLLVLDISLVMIFWGRVWRCVWFGKWRRKCKWAKERKNKSKSVPRRMQNQ